MCLRCEWQDAARRALAVADAQPEWKTRATEFFLDVAATIESKQHVTARQLEAIEEGESEVSED
jgi:hypothetical protein